MPDAGRPAARKRLPPEQRRAAILDAAVRLVLREGATGINMQRVADEAEVSKGLLYAYFPNISDLLLQVYARENRRLHREHVQALTATHTFEDMVTTTAGINRSAGARRRRLLQRLAGHPSIQAAMADEDRARRAEVVEFLSREITGSFRLPLQVARQATALALGFDEEAQHLCSGDPRQLDNIWGAMMVGAMKELQHRYGGADDAGGSFSDAPAAGGSNK